MTSTSTGRLAWSVADQGLASLAPFLVNLLLVRWLSPEAYGAFTLGYAGVFLAGALQTALITEPMLILGPARFRGALSAYTTRLVGLHLALTGSASACVMLALRLGPFHLSADAINVATGACIAAPAFTLPWLFRRAFLAALEPHLAAVGGAITLACTLGGLAVARASGLSAAGALLLLGAASVPAAAALWWLLHQRHGGGPAPPFRELAREHWRLGAWGIVASALTWILSNVYFYVLPLQGGLAAVAGLRAQLNLVTPIIQFEAAIGVLLLPTLVRARQGPDFDRILRRAAVGMLAFAAAAWVPLALLEGRVMAAVYGAGAPEPLLPLAFIALLPATEAMTFAFGSALRSLERPAAVVRAYWFGGASCTLPAAAAAALLDARFAVAGLLLASATTACALALGVARGRGTRTAGRVSPA